MDQLRQAAQQALEALEELNGWQSLAPPVASQAGRQAAINLRAALEQPRQFTSFAPKPPSPPPAPGGYDGTEAGLQPFSWRGNE
jgi:hypothetical protein